MVDTMACVTKAIFSINEDMSSYYPDLLTPPSNEGSPSSSGSSHYISENSASPLHYQTGQMMYSVNLLQDIKEKSNDSSEPYLEIIEQPSDKFRFRYKSEMTGTHGSLIGVNSDKSRKQTFPTVKLHNFDQAAFVRCQIYQVKYEDDDEFRPHAHRLVKKYGKDEHDDPHQLRVIPEEDYIASFQSMGIIHTAKKNIATELIHKKTKLRKEKIAKTEGAFRELNKKEMMDIKTLAEDEAKSINLNVVCLRFDAFVDINRIYHPICKPVYSHYINNLKSALTGELKIVRMDHCTSPAKGNREIFLLVERVTKKNVKVRFFELDDEDNVVWEADGRFTELDVHHQYAIVLRTPPYRNKDITQSVKVYIELVRPSDNARSEAREFKYIASNPAYQVGAKRARSTFDSNDYDSSEIGSELLPTTLSSLTVSNSLDVNSEELKRALEQEDMNRALHDFDSDEFNKVFSNNFEAYTQAVEVAVPQTAGVQYQMDVGGVVLDAPVAKSAYTYSKYTGGYVPVSGRSIQSFDSPVPVKKLVTPEVCSVGEEMETVLKEIKEFLKTNPSIDRITANAQHYLGREFKTNAFHTAIWLKNKPIIDFFLRLIDVIIRQSHKPNNLVNVRTEQRGSALHLATLTNNVELVEQLIYKFKADASIRDGDENTALHLAAVHKRFSPKIMSAILSDPKVASFIDSGNRDGDVPVHLAVKNENFAAVKLLYLKGADFNKRHNTNGFTPLRIALDMGSHTMFKYILDNTKADPEVRDFRDLNPLQVVLKRDPDLFTEVIRRYMDDNNVPFDEVYIKEENMEDSDDGESSLETSKDIKEEPSEEIISRKDVHKDYNKTRNFTPECLEEVSKELDDSGNWQSLAELLDMGHLFRFGTFDSNKSPSKQLLTYAIETSGDSIKVIRDFLEDLDETKAVQSIDRMIKLQTN